MTGAFDPAAFRRTYDERIVDGRFHEVPEYYPRYRTRYEALYRTYAERYLKPEQIDAVDVETYLAAAPAQCG